MDKNSIQKPQYRLNAADDGSGRFKYQHAYGKIVNDKTQNFPNGDKNAEISVAKIDAKNKGGQSGDDNKNTVLNEHHSLSPRKSQPQDTEHVVYERQSASKQTGIKKNKGFLSHCHKDSSLAGQNDKIPVI